MCSLGNWGIPSQENTYLAEFLSIYDEPSKMCIHLSGKWPKGSVLASDKAKNHTNEAKKKKKKKKKIARVRRKKGGEVKKKAMVALLVFFLYLAALEFWAEKKNA